VPGEATTCEVSIQRRSCLLRRTDLSPVRTRTHPLSDKTRRDRPAMNRWTGLPRDRRVSSKRSPRYSQACRCRETKPHVLVPFSLSSPLVVGPSSSAPSAPAPGRGETGLSGLRRSFLVSARIGDRESQPRGDITHGWIA
jgi:hypothetical protein